jgi:CheY-like chemotaxis protein
MPFRGAMLDQTDMAQASATVRVLIVDDQRSFRRAAQRVELTGFASSGGGSGEAALDAARTLQPDLVLMDVHLRYRRPESRRMRAACRSRRPVILLLSTYDVGEYPDDLTRCGADAYLTKAASAPNRWPEPGPPRPPTAEHPRQPRDVAPAMDCRALTDHGDTSVFRPPLPCGRTCPAIPSVRLSSVLNPGPASDTANMTHRTPR